MQLSFAYPVSQVKIDNNRAVEITDKLNAPYYIWKDSVSHREHEEIVNEIYQRSKIAISDRLHVLIAAFTKGTIPTCIPVLLTNKVQDHIDVLRVNDVTMSETDVTKDKVYAFLTKKYLKSFDVNLMLQTKSRLEAIKQEVIKVIS